ncbi:MAG: ribosome maturation factor RimP [Myxococcales bacterium]|nr:ribosome maturation factor RimP [Myxococcales bacterium]
MTLVAHERLPGLDRERVLAAVEPVLRAHGVEGVELVWRTDRGGWLLELTIERPDGRIPGEGITIELCTDVSRDLSAALDVADVLSHAYRLEVGSPGLDRALYSARDYARFAGQSAKLKLREAVAGQRVIHGTLHGLDESGRVVLETEQGLLCLELEQIESGRLTFSWGGAPRKGKPKGKGPVRRASGHGR